MSDTFADITDDDAYDAEAQGVDGLQMAIRFHEDTVSIIRLNNQWEDGWHDLTDDDQDVALVIARGIAERLTGGLDSIEPAARFVQDTRHYFDPEEEPDFDGLDIGGRKLLLDLTQGIQTSFAKQGAFSG